MKITIQMTNDIEFSCVMENYTFETLSYNLENMGIDCWMRVGNMLVNCRNIATIIQEEETK